MKITYTTIIHHLREQLKITSNEYIVADTIHKTSNTKDYPYCKIGREKIAKCAGISRRAVIKIINKLENKGLIERNEKDHLRTTELWAKTVDYDSELSSQLKEQSAQMTMSEVHTKNELSSHNNNKISINDNNKDIYTVFDYWNTKGIIKHKSMDKKTEGAINSKLKDYSKEEIMKAIDNFDVVVKDGGKNYWWTHSSWSLQNFLQRGFDKFKDDSKPFEAYKKKLTKEQEKEQEKEEEEIESYLTEEEKTARDKKFMDNFWAKKKKEQEEKDKCRTNL
jgi:hypothetical protein